MPARAPDDRWPSALVLIGYAVLALGMTHSWWTPLGGRTSEQSTALREALHLLLRAADAPSRNPEEGS